MWFRCCSRLLARLTCAATLATLLVLQVVEPPLVYAIPEPGSTYSPAARSVGFPLRMTEQEAGLLFGAVLRDQMTKRPPILLAQSTSGYDADAAAAGGLLNNYRQPTDQHLQSVPNYDASELERQRGNRYYRQKPANPDDADPLRDDANASTDPSLLLVQDHARRPPWAIDLRSIDAMQGGQVSIPENGCGVFEYCSQTGMDDRPEQCTVRYDYEEAECHEYYTHDIECETVTSTGSGTRCSDHFFFVRLVLQPDGTYTLMGLDTGGNYVHHWNCNFDGPGDMGGWHTLASLPASTNPPDLQFNTAGDGCIPMSTTLSLPAYTLDAFPGLDQATEPSVGLCPSGAQQWQTYFFSSSGRACKAVPHFHDTCTSYKQAPWFEKSNQCLTPAPGFENNCDDLVRTYGKYTENSNTCDPWINMGCIKTSEPCATEDCTTRKRNYTCREEGCTQYQTSVLCSTCVPDPPNPPKCITTDTPANTEFGLATAIIEGQVTAEQNRDNTGVQIYAFPGFAQACKSNPLINCCNQGSAQETANNIQKGIQAMQMAMNAYKAYEAFSTFYTATTTMIEVYGYAMTEAAQLIASEMMSSYFASFFAFSWLGVAMVVIIAVAMLIQMLMNCDEASTETAVKNNLHLCVDVGEYCSQKILFACWGKKHAYCCFVNLIARIIQEQGRAQLGIGWGDPKEPDCRGLTVEELQAIDWERIDWTEYIVDLQKRITVPTTESVVQRREQLMASTDFMGQAHAKLDQYAGLEARVTQGLTVPGTDPAPYFQASARMTLGIVGQGAITLSPGDYGCGRGACPLQLPANRAFTATVTLVEGWGFNGWTGACSGTGTCRFTLTNENWLTATFVQTNLPFNIRVVGPGTVTMSPSRPPCTGECSPSFAPGTVVTLAATPLDGATFLGWGGECSGTGACVLTVRSTSGVTADFASQPTIITFTPNAPGTLRVGVPITWSVGVTGGVSPVQYQFIRDDNGTAVLVQDFGTNPAYTWVPTAADIGTHRLQLAVRSAGSAAAGEDFAITEVFTVAP